MVPRRNKTQKRLILFCVFLWSGFCWLSAQSKELENQIQLALEELIQTESKRVEKAKEILLKIGKPALPKIRQHLSLFTYLATKIEGKSTPVPNYTPTDQTFQIESYYQTKFLHAEKLFQARKYTKALEWIDAILLIEPGNPLQKKFLQLRDQCKEKQFQKEILTASLSAAKTYHEMGEAISLQYLLTNQTESDIFIPREVLQESESWFGSNQTISTRAILQVVFTSKDSYGNISTTKKEYEQSIPQDIKLGSQEQFSLTFPFNPSHPDFEPERFLYREFELYLVLIPAQLNVSSRPTFKAQIKSSVLLLKVLPSGLLQFQENPLKLVTKLYQGKKWDRLFFATLLFKEKERVQGIDFLVDQLAQANQEERRILIVCLKELTGQNFGLDLDQWRYWWKAKRDLFEY